MKVTGWTYWEDERYPHDPADDSRETYAGARRAVIKELREHDYIFSGIYHQEGMTGVPIIDDQWLFGVSQLRPLYAICPVIVCITFYIEKLVKGDK